MKRAFDENDVGKPVFSAENDRIGTVSSIHGDDEHRANVRRDDDSDGLTDKIKDMLGWDDDDDEHELRSDDVDRQEDDGVYLRGR
ncbi:hypothetical protein [Halomarina oriensis]|uniref:PRC-barrel domain containing protein n=1 Tax=Halomarina oriensis TaxID=671145 RepID=A0A6B0GPZ8_9EURY|nr:hypothetical protein [Halomarina oriensis]MWG36922.1 hypothetical protein [Halomarina oriensis]